MQGKLTTDCNGSVKHGKWQEPVGTLSVALTAYTEASVRKYFLQGSKYETLFITHSNLSRNTLHVSDAQGREFRDLATHNKLHINYFNCLLYVYTLGNSTLNVSSSLKYVRVSQVKHSLTVVITEKVFITPEVCANTSSRIKLYVTTTREDRYAQVEADIRMDQTWVVFSCFFGGITFYDKASLTELYSVCDSSHDSPLKMKTVVKGIAFLAPGSKTLIVAYCDPTLSFYASMHIRPSACKGVFINLCSHQSHPPEYLLKMKQDDNIYLTNVPKHEESNTCVSYHLSTKFLPVGTSDFDVTKKCSFILVFQRNGSETDFCGLRVQSQKTQDASLGLHTLPERFIV